MGSMNSVSPSNGSTVTGSQDFTIVLTSSVQIYTCDLYINNSLIANVAKNGQTDLEYGMYGSPTTQLNVFIPGEYVTGDTIQIRFNVRYKGETATIQYNYTYYVSSYTACKGPSWCALSSSTSSGDAVTLSWGAGQSGQNNPIFQYDVWRVELDSDNNIITDWKKIHSMTDLELRKLDVYPPSVQGRYYWYWVHTVGAALVDYGDAYQGCYSDTSLSLIHQPFGTWTDPVLTQNETHVKAIHITEMQERVSTLLSFYEKSAASFTPVVSGQTSLAGWTQHIMQIRNAIDSMNSTHDSWISIPENKPTVAVMNQLRDIIMSL